MDKLRILKEFEKLALGDTLGTDEIRLYLLLLACCGGANGGEIAYGAVKDALGKGLSPAGFKRALLRLSGDNLIEVVSPPFGRTMGDDFTLVYRIFPNMNKKG